MAVACGRCSRFGFGERLSFAGQPLLSLIDKKGFEMTPEQYLNGRKSVVAAKLFFLPMTVPFTSVAGENRQAVTNPYDDDLLVRGASTNLSSGPTARFTAIGGYQWSTDLIPLYAQAGHTAKNNIYVWYKRPVVVVKQQSITANFVNGSAAPDAAGRLCFFCELPSTRQEVNVEVSRLFWLNMPFQLNGVANESVLGTTQPLDFAVLIWGAMYSGVANTNTLTLFEKNYQWSAEGLPLQFYAGLVANNQPVLYYPRPYYLPKNVRLRGTLVNAASETANRNLTFLCQALTK